jgi:Crp-like helix-turn-helix domain
LGPGREPIIGDVAGVNPGRHRTALHPRDARGWQHRASTQRGSSSLILPERRVCFTANRCGGRQPHCTALVGRDGALGPMAGIGRYNSKVRCAVRSALATLKVSAIKFRRLAAEHPALNALCVDYNDNLLSQTRLHAIRYALLSVDKRLAACLLDVSSVPSSDSISLTQEVIAEMLAIRRTSVTDAGSKLKAAGIISYSRGEIQILDRAGLLKLSEDSGRRALQPAAQNSANE